jgi:hypothetical protein
MKLNWKVVAGMLMGLAIAGWTVISQALNSENRTGWGLKNSTLLFVGILIFVASLLYRRENFLGSLVNTRTGQMAALSAVLGGLIALIYIWVISIGTWTTWPATTNYYDLLANAFRHGQLHLETKPDPALLALQDPYNPDNREGIPVLWDLTLYRGEYYLYWGPVPALLLGLVKLFYTPAVTDNILTFGFMVGLLVFQILLILEFLKNYFQETPAWVLALSISFIGLINPILYVLLEPRIYEAAVVGGQFFFIGGLYWLFKAFHKPSRMDFTLAGILFALAVGCRTTLVIPITFLALVALIRVVKGQPDQSFKLLAAFALPLVLGAVGYGWYNYARFNSFTEFGLSYQLTQTDIHATLNESFSAAYALPNLFKLLANPFETKHTFPFIKAVRWGGPAWFKGYNPKIYDYYAEDITGVLIASPFLIFVFLAAASNEKNIRWITASLTGSSLLLFLTLLLFFYLTMRYLLDLLPALSLLACIGFWQGFQLLKTKQTVKILYGISATGLWAYTIVVSFLVCYSSNLHRIRIYNPELIQNITWAFNHAHR